MANTTNLNLEKPLDTDQALISVINSNSDKIDAYAGSTNQALLAVRYPENLGAIDSISTLSGKLDTALSGLDNYATKPIKFNFTENASPFVATVVYTGAMYKPGGELYANAIVYANSSPTAILCYRTQANGWRYEQLARKSELNKGIQTASYVYNFTVNVSRTTWICGILLSNSNGGGNKIEAISVANAGQVAITTIFNSAGNNAVTSCDASQTGKLIFSVKNSSGTALRFDEVTWVGMAGV